MKKKRKKSTKLWKWKYETAKVQKYRGKREGGSGLFSNEVGWWGKIQKCFILNKNRKKLENKNIKLQKYKNKKTRGREEVVYSLMKPANEEAGGRAGPLPVYLSNALLSELFPCCVFCICICLYLYMYLPVYSSK